MINIRIKIKLVGYMPLAPGIHVHVYTSETLSLLYYVLLVTSIISLASSTLELRSLTHAGFSNFPTVPIDLHAQGVRKPRKLDPSKISVYTVFCRLLVV